MVIIKGLKFSIVQEFDVALSLSTMIVEIESSALIVGVLFVTIGTFQPCSTMTLRSIMVRLKRSSSLNILFA